MVLAARLHGDLRNALLRSGELRLVQDWADNGLNSRRAQKAVIEMTFSLRALVRLLCVGVANYSAAACDPLTLKAIAVAPQPEVGTDSSTRVALALARRLATRDGLETFVPEDNAERGWAECFSSRDLYLCGKVREGEVQFAMYMPGTGFSPQAALLWRELQDSLRATFGASSVRGCTWTNRWKGHEAGCDAIKKSGS